MQIDIEKLNRKTPYPEPSEDFFKQMQANVISQTVRKNPVAVKKNAKVFSLNLKWMAAAAVILIGGITAFLGFDNTSETQNFAIQKPIVDSVYNINEPVLPNSSEQLANNEVTEEHHTDVVIKQNVKNHHIASSKANVSDVKSFNNTDRQVYAVETKRKPEAEVEKVLVAFTPDQLKDLDRNSEQDVYLDLYN